MPTTETPMFLTRVIESPAYELNGKKYPAMFCAQIFGKEVPSSDKQTRKFAEMQFGEWKPSKLEAIDSLQQKESLEGMKKVSP